MAQQTKHTPLQGQLKHRNNGTLIYIDNGEEHLWQMDSLCSVAGNSLDETKANAEMIVKAVNNHDKLVEALKGFIDNCAENPKIATNQIQYYKSHFKKLLQSIKD